MAQKETKLKELNEKISSKLNRVMEIKKLLSELRIIESETEITNQQIVCQQYRSELTSYYTESLVLVNKIQTFLESRKSLLMNENPEWKPSKVAAAMRANYANHYILLEKAKTLSKVCALLIKDIDSKLKVLSRILTKLLAFSSVKGESL
ncbi:MAG: hypothetical protein QXG39_07170 [Candidatus Aenigmatarchaeota archaeon]